MDDIDLADVMELEKLREQFPNLGSVNQWRHRIYARKSNGLLEAKALIKRDRRWWIVLSRYQVWLEAGSS